MSNNQIGIKVGIEEAAVNTVLKAILAILDTPNVDQSTKVHALDVFSKSLSVNGMVIQNCHVDQRTELKLKVVEDTEDEDGDQ